MNSKISVITVVFNDVANIRKTMESFFSQTWKDKEYIVIDGGSTDGTVEVIKEFSDKLAYWCSEKDEGIYDAMNKGIAHCVGDWINILNSGDSYVYPDSLEQALVHIDSEKVDVVYGNSLAIGQHSDKYVFASPQTSKMETDIIYRHGSSLIKTTVQKKYLYDLNKRKKLGYALDWDMIYRVYKAGYKFQKVDVTIEAYQEEGISNNIFKSTWYNYLVISQGEFSFKKFVFFIKKIAFAIFHKSFLYPCVRAFAAEYMVNDILPHIPFWSWRKYYLKRIRMKIGKGTFIMKKNYLIYPWLISIGEHSHINRGCVLDGRGTIFIGNNVSISHNVNIITGSHDIQSQRFDGIFESIVIEDYAWLGVGCTILNNVHIGKGAVVCAGAVVTKDVPDYDVVAGIPAKKISERNHDIEYHCIGYQPLM
jgi:acetyltransferase-like isoleucine patch superfamily enzyme